MPPRTLAGVIIGGTPHSAVSFQRSAVSGQPVVLKYWLEDIDLNGQRTWHGPVTPALSSKPLTVKASPKFLSELGIKQDEKYRNFWKAQEVRERLSEKPLKRSKPSVQRAGQALDALVGQPKEVSIRSAKLRRATDSRNMQWVLADSPAVKISIKEEGWYRVTQGELVGAGLDPSANPRYLQLYVDGREQPIRVISHKGKRSDSLEAIEFYGVGLDAVSSDTRVYWLTIGSKPGKRLSVSNGRGGAFASPSFPYAVEKKERSIYFAALKNGDENNFFGRAVTGVPVDQLLSVLHLDPSAPGNAALEVSLQGVTAGPHRVKVLLNTVEVGEVAFEGQARGSAQLTIPQSWLHEGENLVTLIAQEGETDVSFIDSIRLTYWRAYTAAGNALKFSGQGGKYLSVAGFSGPEIRVIDITDAESVIEVAGDVVSDGPSGYTVSFQASGKGQRTFLAFTEERIMKPADIKGNKPSAWHKERNGAELVVISHRDFFEALQPLKALREGQGRSVALVDVEDIYDEFSFGLKTPQALREFLLWAKARWPQAPRFALLVGDASFDPRNYLGLGNFDFVPTKLVDTSYLETSSDDWFADFNGDGLPEMAVGRLPVRTIEEAHIIVSKIVGYEKSASPTGVVSLVADMADGNFDFEAASKDLKALLPGTTLVAELYRGQFPDDDQFQNTLLQNLNQGPLLVNYLGHGSVEIWRGMVFDSEDAKGLTNGLNLPFFVNMTCLNGFFHDLYSESLAESLLKAERGGALAVWTSSGLTEPRGQLMMNKELIQLLFNENSLTIGEAIIRAKAAVSDQDIRRSWILLGDPTTRLKRN